MYAVLLVLTGCFAQQPAPLPSPPPPAPYQIGAGDALDIIVWREEKVSGPVQVRPDGKITVPLVGDVGAAGLTPEQLAEDLRQGLARYIESPNVVVRVTSMGSRRFFVIGNVRAPGMYDMRPEQTFLQALAVSGGFTDFANRKKIELRRATGERSFVHWYRANENPKLDYPVFPNDFITVRKKTVWGL